MKKSLAIIIIIVIVLLGLILSQTFFKKPKISDTAKPKSSPKIENINQLPLEKRPFIIIEPKSVTRPEDIGHWITVTVSNINNYKSLEYDVEYQTGNLIQGFMHKIDFVSEKPPFSKEGFFGSESKGKYKYDDGVIGGSILFKFFRSEDSFDALKTYFNLQNMTETKGLFTSNDGKASLQIGAKDLSSSDYLVISSTLGLPLTVTGKVLSEPYGFYSSETAKFKEAVLTIKSKEDLTKAKILGWDGSKWQEYKITVKEDSASSSIPQTGTYVLVGE